MARTHKPRAGSLAYIPRKRAKKESPRIHSWPEKEEGILGFSGYKAGMTHVLALDERKNSPTSGLEISIPATVVDAPPMFVLGIRVYSKGYAGKKTLTDIWSENIPKELNKKTSLPKKTNTKDKLAKIKEKTDEIDDVRLIVSTQPKLAGLSKKKPDVMEVGLGGSIEDKIKYAEENLGKEIRASSMLSENTFVDVIAVTKGKGFAGVIKRYGIRKQSRKASKKRRHLGTGGTWTPARKLWSEPLPGQKGYHTRTEYNKLILKVSEDSGGVNPSGGFVNYGQIKGDYIIIHGSIPGSAKRLVRITYPRRSHKEGSFSITDIDVESKQGA